MLTGGGVRDAPSAAPAAHLSAPPVGWDPYEVWRTRVLLPRLAAAHSAATPATVPTDTAQGTPRPPMHATVVPTTERRAAQRSPQRPRPRVPMQLAERVAVLGRWAVAISVAFTLVTGAFARSERTD